MNNSLDITKMVKRVHKEKMEPFWQQMRDYETDELALEWILSTGVLTPSEIQVVFDRLNQAKKELETQLEGTNLLFVSEAVKQQALADKAKEIKARYEEEADDLIKRSLLCILVLFPVGLATIGILSIFHLKFWVVAVVGLLAMASIGIFSNYRASKKISREAATRAKKEAIEWFKSSAETRAKTEGYLSEIEACINLVKREI